MPIHPFFKLPSRRRLIVIGSVVLVPALGWLLWSPGTRLTDGRHDHGHNGLWMQHGWIGDDEWFARNGKQDRMAHLRDPAILLATAALCRERHMTDLFPHLCPAGYDGFLPGADDAQLERLLDAFPSPEFRVLPWIGGNTAKTVQIDSLIWRTHFAASAAELLIRHPRLAGVHVNIEPCPSGNADFLSLLDGLRAAIPKGKLLSVAAYPPPTIWQREPDVHWEEGYFRQVAARCDQIAVMMYDTALHNPKLYRNLMRAWTRESLEWSGNTPVLLGVPAYEDAGVLYHDPAVENISDALMGIHAGLLGYATPPANYQGIAVYSDWEMTTAKWQVLREQFLRP